MLLRTEDHFLNPKGQEFFFQTWSPSKWNATLVITHGMSEHSECYNALAQDLAPLGWKIIAWDMQGHGRSWGQRGFVGNFLDFVEDLQSCLKTLKAKGELQQPYALLSHSLGGLVTLRYLVDHADCDAKAVALSSPALGLTLEVSPVKDYAAHFLNRFLPRFTLQNDLNYSHLSRDAQVVAALASDPLRHDRVSAPLYLGMLNAMKVVAARASEIRKPILMQLAGTDYVVSCAASEALFDKLGATRKKKIVYPESYHEIFNDLDRLTAIHDLNQELRKLME